MADFGQFRGFGDKLFEGQLPTKLGAIGSNGFLLDFYGNASAAYSTRKLRFNYTGSAIRVRRLSDNTEQDIGFNTLGELDSSSLNNFCSGTNGFVTTWYDQSGNSRNIVQTTAANQPQIVSGGSILVQNNKPSLRFDGVSDFLQLSSTLDVNGLSFLYFYTVAQTNNTTLSNENKSIYHFAETGSWGQVYLSIAQAAMQLRFGTGQANNTVNATFTASNLLRLLTSYKNNTSDLFDINGNNIVTATGKLGTLSGNATTFTLGRGNTTVLECNISEFLIYPINHSTIKSNVESNINTYYGIY